MGAGRIVDILVAVADGRGVVAVVLVVDKGNIVDIPVAKVAQEAGDRSGEECRQEGRSSCRCSS